MGNVLNDEPLVIGLGSDHGDDQAGWLVIHRLRELGHPEGASYLAIHPADILDVVDPKRATIVCDACVASGAPGRIRRISWPTECLLNHNTRGTHDLSLRQILMLGQQLQCLPPTITIWTIEAQVWLAGSPPTQEVEAAALRVADEIWKVAHNA